MQKHHLFLTFPCKDTSSIKQIFLKNESTPWTYLGQNYFKKRYMEKELKSQFIYINISRLHNEVAGDLRQEYVNWIDDLNRHYGNDLEWWFGSISSRNPYNSNIFQYCCYLEILERLWNCPDKRPKLIVLESIELAKTIQKWAIKKNIAIEIINFSKAKQKFLTKDLFSFLRWWQFAAILLLRWVAAFITRKFYKIKKPGTGPYVIVDTFIHDYCLSNNGTFKDRYFPYLHEYLAEKNMNVLVHPVLFGFRYNYFSIYRKMRKSNTHFIFQEDFLTFSDYLSALAYPIKRFRQKFETTLFHDFDLSNILIEEQRNKSATLGIFPILIYRLFLRLGQSRLKVKQIIDWYENQVIDKALIAGVRQAFPQVKIIGVQMFIHSPNFISLFPSQSEVNARIVPHILLETSQYQCQVTQSFTKNIACKPVAALRYSHVFNSEGMNEYDLNQKPQRILVLLPFSISEAIELLETFKEIHEQIKDDIQILIKGHPDYTSKELMEAFGECNWPNKFKIFNGNLSDALKSASVVISSNSSSMVEAAAKGIPVIFLGRQTALNYNTLANLNMEIITECFSTSELVEAVNKYLNVSLEEKMRYKEMGKKVRDIFFEPVNEKTLLPFLDIEKDE